jgi:hypothetical protein
LPWQPKEKIFFKKTQRARALIFGMKYLLVSVYQVCSNKAPGVKFNPAQGVINFLYMFIVQT